MHMKLHVHVHCGTHVEELLSRLKVARGGRPGVLGHEIREALGVCSGILREGVVISLTHSVLDNHR